MANETEKLIKQVAIHAPKEFARIKRMRNYWVLAILTIIILSYLFENYLEQAFSFCGATFFELFSALTLTIILRESWKCPVCYEVPGFILSNPKFCAACGAKLDE